MNDMDAPVVFHMLFLCYTGPSFILVQRMFE